MNNLASAACFLLVGGLILIQRDVDGALLVNGWKGLGLACIASLVAANVFLVKGLSGTGDAK
jgi:hypothetical protein